MLYQNPLQFQHRPTHHQSTTNLPFSATSKKKKKKKNPSAFDPCFTAILDPSSVPMMCSSLRLFGRQKTLHQTLGGGFNVILWRRKDVTTGTLFGTIVGWVVFELSGYTLLSLVSNVMLLLFSVLFVWAKSAEVLNRPPPPIPELHLSQEVINNAATFVRFQVNVVLSLFYDIALGKDPKLFSRVAVCLLLVSVFGSCADFVTIIYSCLVILLTFPVLYEKYEDDIDRYVILNFIKLQMYENVYAEFFSEAKEWILEKLKES